MMISLLSGAGFETATQLLPLWLGARSTEFDWKYIQSSFDANINLVSLCIVCILGNMRRVVKMSNTA